MLEEQIRMLKEVNWKECMFGKRMRKWAFWFIVAFLSALTIKDVIDLIIEYAEQPKQSDMNMVFNESMTMPNITFCMSRTQAWSHFKINSSEPPEQWDQIIQDNLLNMTDKESFLNDRWDLRMVMEAYEVVATLNSIERETTAHGSARSINVFRTEPRLASKRKMVKMWLNAIAERNITFAEFTEKVGEETIRRSMQRFQRTTFNEDLVIRTRFRTSWISMMQFCFQPYFDKDNFYDIGDQGNFFTMMLSHNAENLNGKDVECMSVDFHGRPSSLSRFVQGRGRARDGYNDDLCLGMRHEVTVEVRARYVMLENDDNGTACRNVEEGEDTEFDCRLRCRMKMIRSLCNCTAVTLSYLVKSDDEFIDFPLCDYEKCELDVQRGKFSEKECTDGCYRDCTQIRYEIDHEQQGRMARKDLTLVNLNWGSFEYLTLEQKWVWSIPTFIAALGGSIGMWLGLSILSLIQGGTYLYTYLTREVIKKRLISSQSSQPVKRKPTKENGGNKFSVNPLASPFGNKNGDSKVRLLPLLSHLLT
uniref:Amiloride-sensitive sodium channel n=1 Tax=Ascaris lumbricoides TaxID=6252 RepID=A0A9J2PU91_ASCLU